MKLTAMQQRFQPAPDLLATVFSAVLRKWLTPAQMAEVIIRNDKETDPNICHSHDFCDANMAMDTAFRYCTGFTACDTSDESGGCCSSATTDTWNAAWTIAKQARFASPPADLRLVFKLKGERTQRLFVRSVREAMATLERYLGEDEVTICGAPTVFTKGKDVVAILSV